jgi:polyhydroxyalkanoate synthesis regulator phasin
MSGEKKKRRSVSVDAEVDEILKNNPNASQLVNSLVREYEFAGSSREAAVNRKIAEKESELEQARREKARYESKIDRLERDIEQLRDKLHGLNEEEKQAVQDVIDMTKAPEEGKRPPIPEEKVTTENQAIVMRANNVGMDAERFVQEVRERL